MSAIIITTAIEQPYIQYRDPLKSHVRVNDVSILLLHPIWNVTTILLLAFDPSCNHVLYIQ